MTLTDYWKDAPVEEFIGEERLGDSGKFQSMVAKCLNFFVLPYYKL
jgi:hypothetical protein